MKRKSVKENVDQNSNGPGRVLHWRSVSMAILFWKKGLEKSRDYEIGVVWDGSIAASPHILPPVVEWRSSATMQMKDFLLLTTTEKNSWYVSVVSYLCVRVTFYSGALFFNIDRKNPRYV